MNNIIENKSQPTAKGTHIITVSECTSDYAQKILALIDENVKKWREAMKERKGVAIITALHEEYRHLMHLLENKHKVQEIYVENITTTVGRAALIDRLVGTNTYSGNVNYCALGTSSTAPAVGQTTLVTETYRKALTSGTPSSNVGYLETFFTPTEVTGSLEEYGYFIDGTGTANTGQLFNRFTQSVTKTNTQSLNVLSTITLNDA